MKTTRAPWQRRLLATALVAVAFELVYVIAGNLLLSGDYLPRLVEQATPNVKLHWDRARTWWPGQTSVEGFSMQLEDESVMQMDLRVEHATTTLRLWPLLARRLSFDHTRAHGVSFRMVTKMKQADWDAASKRVAAFPKVEGLSYPPIKPESEPSPPTHDEIEALFGIEMTDVVTETKELWFDEYRYVGSAHATGGFGLKPLTELWVGPAWLTFDGGKLTVAEHTLLPRFTAAVEFEIAKVPLLDQPASIIATTLNMAARGFTAIDDIGIAQLYVDGLEIGGAGQLALNIRTIAGKVMPDSTLKVTIDTLVGQSHGFSFAGRLALEAGVTERMELKLGADLIGQLTTPVLEKQPLVVNLESAQGELVTDHNDLHAGPKLQRVSGRVNEARAVDARPVTEAAGIYVPVIAQAVLGDGPLTGAMTVTHTPAYTVLRLKSCKLGGANMVGAMLHDARGWNGAAAGMVGALPVGLRVEDGKLSYRPSANDAWLTEAIDRLGISPETTAAVAP